MATPSAMAFHEDSRRLYRGICMNSVKYYAGRNERRINPTYKGMVKNSTGSWNAPFVGSQDESMKPFNPMPGANVGSGVMRGGIRNNANYPKVKELLKQRAVDMEVQDNPEYPPPMPMESLTDEDKYKIKFNSILMRLDDVVETGDFGVLTDDLWREIVILLANLAPTMDITELNQLLEYWDNLVYSSSMDIVAKGEATQQLRRKPFVINRLISRIREFIKTMVGNVNRSEAEKRLLARTFVRKSGFSGVANDILREAKEYADDYIESIGSQPSLALVPLSEAVDIGDYEEEEVAQQPIEGQMPAVPSEDINLRRFIRLYNRSPPGSGAASPDLMSIYKAFNPRVRTTKSRTQVKNDVLWRLNSQTTAGEMVRRILAEKVPEITR